VSSDRKTKRTEIGIVLQAAAVLLATLSMVPFHAIASTFEKIYASSNEELLTKWGRRYERGEKVRRNIDHAIRLYCKAAKKGHAPAQYYLGWLYAYRDGVRRDEALAAAWLSKAADSNHPQARNTLKLLRTKKKSSAQCLLSDGLPIGIKQRYATNPANTRIVNMVCKLAPEYRLDPNLVLAVVEVESNFDPKALSPKNAQGLMQLIPETAQRFGVKDVWDPEQNLRGGMAYLRWLLDHFNGDVKMALAGYNAGEGAVRSHRGVPPYNETRAYVKRIARRLSP